MERTVLELKTQVDSPPDRRRTKSMVTFDEPNFISPRITELAVV